MSPEDLQKMVEGMVQSLHYGATDNAQGDCDECTHFVCHDEHHPYGSTTATERLCDCTIPDPKDCPVVEQVVGALYLKVYEIPYIA